MPKSDFTAQEIADFLQDNPRFFVDHASIFTNLEIPSENKGNVLSLAQKQMLSLKQRVDHMQESFHTLSHFAFENQEIMQSVHHWCILMLAEKNHQTLPQAIVKHLELIFEGLQVALKVWAYPVDSPYQASNLPESVKAFDHVYTGSNYPDWVDDLFEDKPQSVAILPLMVANQSIGMLVFASDQTEHFSEAQEHGFLYLISALSSAALSRLKED